MQCSAREGCVRAWNSRRTHTGHHLHWSKGRATKRMTANNDDDAEEAGVTKKTLYGETPIFESSHVSKLPQFQTTTESWYSKEKQVI